MNLLGRRERHPSWLAPLGERPRPFGRIGVAPIALNHLPAALDRFVEPDIEAFPDRLLRPRHGGWRVLQNLLRELFRTRPKLVMRHNLRDQADRLGLPRVHALRST